MSQDVVRRSLWELRHDRLFDGRGSCFSATADEPADCPRGQTAKPEGGNHPHHRRGNIRHCLLHRSPRARRFPPGGAAGSGHAGTGTRLRG